MVENAVGFEGEVLVELGLLAISPGPISGLSDKRRCEPALKEGGKIVFLLPTYIDRVGFNRSLSGICAIRLCPKKNGRGQQRTAVSRRAH